MPWGKSMRSFMPSLVPSASTGDYSGIIVEVQGEAHIVRALKEEHDDYGGGGHPASQHIANVLKICSTASRSALNSVYLQARFE